MYVPMSRFMVPGMQRTESRPFQRTCSFFKQPDPPWLSAIARTFFLKCKSLRAGVEGGIFTSEWEFFEDGIALTLGLENLGLALNMLESTPP